MQADDETKPTESTEAESAPTATKENEQNASSVEKPVTPAKDSKEKEGRRGILSAIRFPSVSSVFSRKKKVISPRKTISSYALNNRSNIQKNYLLNFQEFYSASILYHEFNFNVSSGRVQQKFENIMKICVRTSQV